MFPRRRKGATLGLVAVCVMVIVVVGVGVYFLAKILGGGRELANATDAGALNVAKQALAISVPAPDAFKEFEYPNAGSGITLLTYNRCVAKVMIVAMNAKAVGNQGPANAANLVGQLNDLGTALTGALGGNSTFNDLSTANQHRMMSEGTVTGAVTKSAYMKPQGATNIFFSNNISSGMTVPPAKSDKTPKNVAGIASANGFYMAGYEPITLATGAKVYGTPVFPQLTPHLVANGDFGKATGASYGAAPPNSFQSNSQVKEMKTQLFAGAVACAIIGAVNAGGKSGSIGNGFEFPAAIPYGYIEIQNLPANKEPPGYDGNDYNGNIFNNWLGEDTFMMGDKAATQNSVNLLFSHSNESVQAWANWANGNGPMPNNVPAESKNAVYFKPDGVPMPVQLTSANANGLKAQLAKIKFPRPAGDNIEQPVNCFEMLSDPERKYGLMGPCVPGAAAITTLTGQDFPKDPPASAGNNFSNVDQAKAQVLIAFSNKGPAPNKPYEVQVNPVGNSGLGVYAELYGSADPYQMPNPAPAMPVPGDFHLPLQQIGSVWQLLNQVGGCATTSTLDDLVLRCQEIQPKTTRNDVISLLKASKLPMADYTKTEPYKMYIYLPSGDLSKALVCETTQPPGFKAGDPDGVNPKNSSFPYTPCQVNKYLIQGQIVNTHAETGDGRGDELVHQAPYLDEDPPAGPGGMVAYDWAHWWPASGAKNNLGRLWFENGVYGSVHFSHIN